MGKHATINFALFRVYGNYCGDIYVRLTLTDEINVVFLRGAFTSYMRALEIRQTLTMYVCLCERSKKPTC